MGVPQKMDGLLNGKSHPKWMITRGSQKKIGNHQMLIDVNKHIQSDVHRWDVRGSDGICIDYLWLWSY